CRAWFGGPAWLTVLALETGVGAEKTEAALAWLLSQPILGGVPYRPRVVLSAGFAGALREGLHVGDIVLATEVAGAAGDRGPTPWAGELPPVDWRPPLRRGRLVSSTFVVGTPAGKRCLGTRAGALAVDMESATAARLCSERVPFGCVRAISDNVHTGLSP